MAKFRKKPIIVEATQWLGWDKGPHDLGVEEISAREDGAVLNTINWQIWTLEGWVRVTPGDWIVIGVAGERYPVKPEIFAETFEAVDAA